MEKINNIPKTVKAQDIIMGDIPIKQPLPVRGLTMVDPFLLIHHAGPLVQVPHQKSVLDIGGHPHRGFEPVTFIFKGQVHHTDSRGNDSIINEGGVQWMTAGMGIVHSEAVPEKFLETGGELELIQLWINLPAEYKMIQPRYQGFQKDEIPTIELDNGSVKLNVISGHFLGAKGPVESLTGIQAYTVEMTAGSSLQIEISSENHSLVYQLHGESKVNNGTSADHHLSVLPVGTTTAIIEAFTDSTFLFVSGTPINEPVMQHGPFVMNNQTEILEAMRDYQMGKMGILI